MAQLVEWSLPTPKVRGLNPVIGIAYLLSADSGTVGRAVAFDTRGPQLQSSHMSVDSESQEEKWFKIITLLS